MRLVYNLDAASSQQPCLGMLAWKTSSSTRWHVLNRAGYQRSVRLKFPNRTVELHCENLAFAGVIEGSTTFCFVNSGGTACPRCGPRSCSCSARRGTILRFVNLAFKNGYGHALEAADDFWQFVRTVTYGA